ncbi:MAG: iron-containing alcohol dehydrogenase [Pseudomonadota bacterium]
MTIGSFSFGPTTAVAFGVGRIEKIAGDVERLAGAGAAVLLAADPALPRLADRVEAALAKGGSKVTRFSDIRSDPLASQIDACAEAARKADARILVALGGGSTLDVAKMAAAIALEGREAEFYALAKEPLPAKGLPRICVPTTAGTGSETTRVSVYTSAKGDKVWGWGDALKADLALLDPTLTVGLPAALTAATGVDALVHAIEACTIRRANPFNDSTCHQAIRLIAGNLKRAVEVPDDLDARGHLQIAAALAGIGIDNAGTGVGHAVGHALGAIGHVHHGRAVGLALRAAIGWNAEVSPERHAAVAAVMGVPVAGRSAKDIGRELAGAFDAFLRSVGLPISLAEDGLGAKDVKRLAEVTMAPENKPMRDANCREITAGDAEWLAREVLTAA